MKVNPKQLVEGCILSAEVSSLSNTPIIPKNTVITKKFMDILRVFLVREVQVEPTLVNGDPFRPTEIIEDEKNIPTDKEGFSSSYLKVVQHYKKMFQSWQAGSPIDMPEVRKVLVPLLEEAVENPNQIFRLHHYSTKEDYLYHHSITVAVLSALLGKFLHFPKGDWIQIGIAGAMSDCGMAKVEKKVLDKKSSLTFAEFEEVKKHPLYSYNMLKQVLILKEDVRKAVYQHHERIDGSGYPEGLKADKLHPYAKIVAVSDVYHAMTSERNYKSKQSPFKVLESILQDHFGKFDLKVVQALTKTMTNFSTGTRIMLSNNQTGTIVFMEQKAPTRPMVKLDTGEIIQLVNQRQLFIEEIL